MKMSVWRKAFTRTPLYLLLILSSIAMAFPLAYMLVGSISTIPDYISRPAFPYPTVPDFSNYLLIFNPQRTDMLKWIVNTLIRAAWYIVIPATLAVLAGYVFAKLKFRGRDAAFISCSHRWCCPASCTRCPPSS